MRVVSWNIHSARGLDGRVSVHRIAETLRDLDADAIGLNEVRRTPFGNQPALLSELLTMNVAFQRNLVVPGMRYGNALATRGTINRAVHVRLPDRREPRGLLQAEVTLGDQRCTIGVTHLGLHPRDRVCAKQRIAEALTPDRPTILLGDFNEEPSILGELKKHFTVVSPGPTFPAERPTRAIDLILISNHWRVVSSAVVSTRHSDHLPLVADLVLAE